MQIFAAENSSSTVNGRIESGELSMTAPDSQTFTAVLQKEEQMIELPDTTMVISDYRGLDEGWSLTVSSPNFEEYKDHIRLTVSGKDITKTTAEVASTEARTQAQDLSLATVVYISENAMQGDFSARLEWVLSPNSSAKISE